MVRIITSSDFYAHTNPLFKQLKILKLEDLFVYNTQLFMYKTLVLDRYQEIKDSILDAQINHNYDTRINNLRLPYCRTKKDAQNLRYQLSKNWNLLPVHIESKESLNAFIKVCKIHHLSQY